MLTSDVRSQCACLAQALLDECQVCQPPVPVEELLRHPPRALGGDLGLVEALPFGEALWVRSSSGQGRVLVNPGLPRPRRRAAMAAALFTGLCAAGRAGPGFAGPDLPPEAARLFARCLLLPERLLPAGWHGWQAQALAGLFVVPVEMVLERLIDLRG